MTGLLAVVSALFLAVIPLQAGFRRGPGAASPARLRRGAAELAARAEAWARRTGTGLAFREIAAAAALWALGGAAFGAFAGGVLIALLAGLGGLGLYLLGLEGRRDEFLVRQTADIEKALGVLAMLAEQGLPLPEALKGAADGAGPAGGLLLGELVRRLEAAGPAGAPAAVREWAADAASPAAALLAAALLAGLEAGTQVAPVARSLRTALGENVAVLARARAAARGIEWQAKFLALYPPLVVGGLSLLGLSLSASPLFMLPVLGGAGLSFFLTHRAIRRGLSVGRALGEP